MKAVLIALAAVFVVCLCDIAGETLYVRVHEYVFADDDIPRVFDGFRIVFLSDIHHGPFSPRERLAALVRRVNDAKPDLILFGGDYVHHEPHYIEPCFFELMRLTAPEGVWGVLGNHDHWAGAERTREAMRRHGIRILDNTGAWIGRGGERIRIGGVGDLWTDRQDPEAARGDAGKNDFVILVSHNPDAAESLDSDAVDLMLSGHTHGGQITFFGLYAPFLPTKTGQKYRSGLVEAGACRVIITNGVGTITPPVRFFAPAEIVLVTLRSSR